MMNRFQTFVLISTCAAATFSRERKLSASGMLKSYSSSDLLLELEAAKAEKEKEDKEKEARTNRRCSDVKVWWCKLTTSVATRFHK